MRSGLAPQLPEQLGSTPISESAGAEVVDVEVQVPLEVPADSGAVLLYEREEPEDSPISRPIAFANSENTAFCRRLRSTTPITA